MYPPLVHCVSPRVHDLSACCLSMTDDICHQSPLSTLPIHYTLYIACIIIVLQSPLQFCKHTTPLSGKIGESQHISQNSQYLHKYRQINQSNREAKSKKLRN